MKITSVLIAILALAAAGCSDDEEQPFELPEGCNPLAAEHHCMLPYPTDA